ncbi:hypothetical protein EDB89DRAFT_1985064 [Lactarius sanguifluus]|nr:hypothetical protein EDB89DRAFT_1985064 [Lactarius sanguifluus]
MDQKKKSPTHLIAHMLILALIYPSSLAHASDVTPVPRLTAANSPLCPIWAVQYLEPGSLISWPFLLFQVPQSESVDPSSSHSSSWVKW